MWGSHLWGGSSLPFYPCSHLLKLLSPKPSKTSQLREKNKILPMLPRPHKICSSYVTLWTDLEVSLVHSAPDTLLFPLLQILRACAFAIPSASKIFSDFCLALSLTFFRSKITPLFPHPGLFYPTCFIVYIWHTTYSLKPKHEGPV